MLIPLLMLAFAAPILGQNLGDPLTRYVPKQAPSRKQIDLRASLHLYVDGLLWEREEKFSEALKAFESAAKLDPNAPAIIKAQVPILLALARYADALSASQKVVALDPNDIAMWYVQAKLHKSTLKYADAINALEQGLKSPELKENPGAAQQMYLELAGLFESTDKFGPAADAFSKAAAILEHPDEIADKAHIPREAVLARASETYEKIGQLYRKAKRYDESITALRTAQERAPERASRLNFVLAQVCEEKGDLKQALTYVDAYLRTQPLSTDPYELKISLLRRLKQTDAIVPFLEEAATRERFNTTLQILLANECAAAKQSKKAEAIYQKLVEESPSMELYRPLFHLYKDEGPAGMLRILAMLDKVMDKSVREDAPAPVGANQHFRAMVSTLRADGELARKLVEAVAQQKKGTDGLKFDTVFFLGIIADRFHKYEEAERFYRQCLTDKNLSVGNEAILYVGLIAVLRNTRQHEAQAKMCEQALAKAKGLNPVPILQELARAQSALKHYDESLQTIERARKLATEAEAFSLSGLRVGILSLAKRYADAESECLALLKKHERPAEAISLRYMLSGIYAASKQQAKSEEQLQIMLKMDPDNVTANNDLGYLWAEQGKNLPIAEEMIRKALDVDRSQRRRNPNFNPDEDKDNAAYVDSLGWVLYRRGQIEEARKELERATTLGDSDDPVIYEHLGDVYSRMKMRPQATQAWQRSLELYNQGARSKDDERMRDIRRKIERAKEEVGGR
jgi:tetratricopeptide (TPR) repeat protein